MLVRIPVQDGPPAWRQRTPLDGTDYLLDFAWNERANAWYLSIFTVDGEPICRSKKIVCGVPLLTRKRWDLRSPPGQIICVDWSETIDVPRLTDLGKTAFLYYMDQETIAEVRS